MHKGQPKTLSQRQLRVGEEVRHALATVFERGEVRDPGLYGVSVTVTEVRMSSDLKKATAFVRPLGGDRDQAEAVVDALHRAQPFLRRRVAHVVRLRYAPDIVFRVDDSFDRVGRIEELLRETGTPPAAPPGKDGDHGA